jgi:arsenate reductase (thioredoxin)
MIRPKFVLATAIAASFFCARMFAQTTPAQPPGKPGNALVTALWLAHAYGTPDALTASKDRQLKVTLLTALRGNASALTWDHVKEIFDRDTFQRIAGNPDKLTVEKMQRMVDDKTPESRNDLFPKIRKHADLLTTQFDLIEDAHREAAAKFVAWVSKNYSPGKPLPVIVICTGNSRRSMLGSTMGNVAATYYGMPSIRFFSGGTTPSAFNPRAIAALREAGVEIIASGNQAARGKAGEENPIYNVRWGKGMEAAEFSRLYTDAQNPQNGFAAILVCSEADAACPVVEGASARFSVPYLDPKAYDGADFEAAKYAECRDSVGRFMLSALMQARRCLDAVGKQ